MTRPPDTADPSPGTLSNASPPCTIAHTAKHIAFVGGNVYCGTFLAKRADVIGIVRIVWLAW